MTIKIAIAIVLLLFLLVHARLRDGARNQRLASKWNDFMTHAADNVLEYMVLAVDEHRVGLRVVDQALRDRDVEMLRHAIGIVEAFSPSLQETLGAARNMAKVVDVLVPMPSLGASVWSEWRLRGLAGFCFVADRILVAASERARVRVWLLTMAFRFCLASLRRSSSAHGPEWDRIATLLQDLAKLGDETELTYRRIVRALDEAGGYRPA